MAPATAQEPATPVDISFWDQQRKGANFFNAVPSRERIEAAGEAGIEFIRLVPNKWKSTRPDFLLGDAGEFRALVEQDLSRVRQFLDDANEAGLKVVLSTLNLPGSRWRQQNGGKDDLRLWQDAKYAPQAAEFWRQLAARLKRHPALAAYNLLNEPHPERAARFHDLRTQQFRPWHEKVARDGTWPPVPLLLRSARAATCLRSSCPAGMRRSVIITSTLRVREIPSRTDFGVRLGAWRWNSSIYECVGSGSGEKHRRWASGAGACPYLRDGCGAHGCPAAGEAAGQTRKAGELADAPAVSRGRRYNGNEHFPHLVQQGKTRKFFAVAENGRHLQHKVAFRWIVVDESRDFVWGRRVAADLAQQIQAPVPGPVDQHALAARRRGGSFHSLAQNGKSIRLPSSRPWETSHSTSNKAATATGAIRGPSSSAASTDPDVFATVKAAASGKPNQRHDARCNRNSSKVTALAATRAANSMGNRMDFDASADNARAKPQEAATEELNRTAWISRIHRPRWRRRPVRPARGCRPAVACAEVLDPG